MSSDNLLIFNIMEARMGKKNLAIIGVGEVPTGTYPGRSQWDIIYETCIQAVRDAGIHKNDVEAVITVAPQAQPQLTAEISFGMIPEELGLKGCKDVCICNAGGASTSNCLRLAEQMIESNQAKDRSNSPCHSSLHHSDTGVDQLFRQSRHRSTVGIPLWHHI